MTPPGIRWRLTLWYGVVLAVILAGFSGVVYLLMRHHLLALTDAALAEESADLVGDVKRCRDAADFPRELGQRYASHEGYEFQISTEGRTILFRSNGLRPDGLPSSRTGLRFDQPVCTSLMSDRLGHCRVATRLVPHPAGPLVVQAVFSLTPNDRALKGLVTVFLLAGPAGLAGVLGGGYWLARRALAPVDRMVAMAREITATRLDRRLDAPNTRDELGRLVMTFNDMFARLERSFEEIRRFTADAAHELRTPLAAMRTEAEVALRAPRDPEQDARTLEDLLEEIERLTRLVTQLLFLCREDAGLVAGEARLVRLDELALDVADHMQVAAREKGVGLEVGNLSPSRVHGDPDRLRQLLFNLLDNAIKFTPPGGTVVLRGESSDAQASVMVEDTGVGIPPEHLPRIFDRFYRADRSRSREVEGTGLGLAICRSIAEAHEGGLRVDSDPGRGTRVTLTIPARPDGATAHHGKSAST